MRVDARESHRADCKSGARLQGPGAFAGRCRRRNRELPRARPRAEA